MAQDLRELADTSIIRKAFEECQPKLPDEWLKKVHKLIDDIVKDNMINGDTSQGEPVGILNYFNHKENK